LSPVPVLVTTLATATLAMVPAHAGAEAAREHVLALSATESLRVVEAGRGDPVVLLPGLFGSAYGYRRVVPLLADSGWRVLVVEPLGVGGSSRPPHADYSLTAQADRVDAVMGRLGVDRALLVAHATAASVALRLAYRHPGRVAGIVSLDGGPAESPATPGFRRAMTFAPLLRLFGGVGRIRGVVRRTLASRSADGGWVTEEVVDGYLGTAARDLRAALAGYRGMARAREPQAIAPHLHEIACPVRLVVGGAPHEGGPGPEEVRLLRERLPRFETEAIPGVGHFVFEEAPAAFVALVNRTREAPRVGTTVAAR